jgi:hypothetical protein
VTRRFYVGAPTPDSVEFEPALAHRLAKVLRLRHGDEITLFDGSGAEAVVRIDALGDATGRGTVIDRVDGLPEPRTCLHLYQAIAKNDRFEWLLEKATEIGVARIVPLIAARSVVRTAEGAGRVDRWRRIVIEAAEQCGRSAVPVVEEPQTFDIAIRAAPGVILVELLAHRDPLVRRGTPDLRAPKAILGGWLPLVTFGNDAGRIQSHGLDPVKSTRSWATRSGTLWRPRAPTRVVRCRTLPAKWRMSTSRMMALFRAMRVSKSAATMV